MLSQSRILNKKVLMLSRKILNCYSLESRFSTVNKPNEDHKEKSTTVEDHKVKSTIVEDKKEQHTQQELKKEAHPPETIKHETAVHKNETVNQKHETADHKHTKPTDDPRIEYVTTPKRKRGRIYKLFMGFLLFGTASLGLELMKVANEKFKFKDSDVTFMKEENRDSIFKKAGCEERIRHIREILHQELVSDYKSSQSDYEQTLQLKKNEIYQNLNEILNTHISNNPEKYDKVAQLVSDLENEISYSTNSELEKKAAYVANLEKLSKIKLIIDSQLSNLTSQLSTLNARIDEEKRAHLTSFLSQIALFQNEFNSIKDSNEVTAISYLFKLKELISEAEDHVSQLDSKIPDDLKSVSQETKEQIFHLRFSIREYFRDLRVTKENLETVVKYITRSGEILRRIKNHRLTIDETAHIQNLEDERDALKMLTNKVKEEVERTKIDFEERKVLLNKICKLSQQNKFHLLEYYNKLEALAHIMERCSVTGGDLEQELNGIVAYVNQEDELVKNIGKELLKDKNTSKNIITTSQIEKGFKKRKEELYRQCFVRGEGYVYGFFAKSMYYMYYYLMMDRLTFQKKYSISEVTKDDSTISKDIRLLNYIEESLKEGNIEECHVLATQLSQEMRNKMGDFIEQCESWIRFRVSLQTIRDHSKYLLSSHFALKN